MLRYKNWCTLVGFTSSSSSTVGLHLCDVKAKDRVAVSDEVVLPCQICLEGLHVLHHAKDSPFSLGLLHP